MELIKLITFLATLVLAATLPITSARAQLARSFVSAACGSDSNLCTRNSPCRSFQRAHDLTDPGGEIDTLDPGGYGIVTITKSISIVSGLGEAGVLVPSAQTGITINAGPSDVVNLRGLLVEGASVGATGIRFLAGSALNIEKCVVRNLTADGIDFLPNSSVSINKASNLAVSDSYVANTFNGIDVAPTGSGIVTATFNRVEVYNSSFGYLIDGSGSSGTVNAVATDSVAGNNGFNGFSATSQATGPAPAPTSLTVVRSTAIENGWGLNADNGATIRVGQSTIVGNFNGWLANLGTVQSYGDNRIDGNQSHNSAPPTIQSK
jgi:hypothetical protein